MLRPQSVHTSCTIATALTGTRRPCNSAATVLHMSSFQTQNAQRAWRLFFASLLAVPIKAFHLILAHHPHLVMPQTTLKLQRWILNVPSTLLNATLQQVVQPCIAHSLASPNWHIHPQHGLVPPSAGRSWHCIWRIHTPKYTHLHLKGSAAQKSGSPGTQRGRPPKYARLVAPFARTRLTTSQ